MAIIEYVYSAHSAFAYLGSQRLLEICANHHVKLIHRPILLSPVLEAQSSLPFGARTQPHVDYFFGREIERWAEYRGVPVVNFRPTYHDADYSLASCMILALGKTSAETDTFAHSLLTAHWRDNADLSDPATLAGIASELGHNANNLMAQAISHQFEKQLQENCDWARSKNIFGSPTYIVDGDPFYGQDHLELVERALRKPFAPTTWANPSIA